MITVYVHVQTTNAVHFRALPAEGDIVTLLNRDFRIEQIFWRAGPDGVLDPHAKVKPIQGGWTP